MAVSNDDHLVIFARSKRPEDSKGARYEKIASSWRFPRKSWHRSRGWRVTKSRVKRRPTNPKGSPDIALLSREIFLSARCAIYHRRSKYWTSHSTTSMAEDTLKDCVNILDRMLPRSICGFHEVDNSKEKIGTLVSYLNCRFLVLLLRYVWKCSFKRAEN